PLVTDSWPTVPPIGAVTVSVIGLGVGVGDGDVPVAVGDGVGNGSTVTVATCSPSVTASPGRTAISETVPVTGAPTFWVLWRTTTPSRLTVLRIEPEVTSAEPVAGGGVVPCVPTMIATMAASTTRITRTS